MIYTLIIKCNFFAYGISSLRSSYVNDVVLLPAPKFSHSSKVAFETDPFGTFRWVSKNSEVVNLISRPHWAKLIFASNFCRHSLFVWKSTVMESYGQWVPLLGIFVAGKKTPDLLQLYMRTPQARVFRAQ